MYSSNGYGPQLGWCWNVITGYTGTLCLHRWHCNSTHSWDIMLPDSSPEHILMEGCWHRLHCFMLHSRNLDLLGIYSLGFISIEIINLYVFVYSVSYWYALWVHLTWDQPGISTNYRRSLWRSLTDIDAKQVSRCLVGRVCVSGGWSDDKAVLNLFIVVYNSLHLGVLVELN